jgi:ribosomal protein S18 acetylase RimI-like enzyme
LSADTDPGYRFKPLADALQREAFSCSNAEIDRWFRKNAWDHHKAFKCRVSTAHNAIDDALVGFYSLCITREPENQLDKYSHLRKHSIGKYFPTLQVHYVAVQKEMKNRGIGTIIMGRIIDAFMDAANFLGVPVMTLTALNPRAAKLYRSLGFVSYGGLGSSRMLLPAQSALGLERADVDRD